MIKTVGINYFIKTYKYVFHIKYLNVYVHMKKARTLCSKVSFDVISTLSRSM